MSVQREMRVGIIGAGLQGRRRALALKRLGGSELVMVADTDKDRAESLSAEMGCQATDDWEEMVARQDIAAVIVCTPPHLHGVMSIAAMQNGKHVLCEKPLARNPGEAEQIVQAARDCEVVLKCGFNFRHHPGVRQARDWLDQGAIGELGIIRCRYGIGGRPHYDKEWRAKSEMTGGGELMDQGLHVLDLSRWFMGDVDEVFGFVSTVYWDVAPLEDNAFVLLRSGQRLTTSIHVSWTQWKNLFSFELIGSDGYITVDGLGGSYGTEKATLGKRELLRPFASQTIEFRGEDRSWDGEWQEFVSAIEEDREPLGSGGDGLEAVRLAYATYESARSRRVVELRTKTSVADLSSLDNRAPTGYDTTSVVPATPHTAAGCT